MEELTQAMFSAWDQYDYFNDTIHCEFNCLNKPDRLTENDKNILRLVYSDEVAIRSNCTQVSKAFNIPKGVYLPSNSTVDSAMNVSASFLDSDASYAVRAFIVNSSGKVSYTSDWINITTPSNLRPADWEWTTNVSKGAAVSFYNGAIRPLTAAEWNAFTTRINEFRKYMGLSNYSFTTVNSNTNFTAAIYNEAVAAIKGISGYGTYLSYATAGVTDALLSSNYTSLRDELNAIP